MKTVIPASVFALLATACVSLQTSPSNSRPDRPEIYMFEGQGTWIGFGRALPAGAFIALHGPGWSSTDIDVYTTRGKKIGCNNHSKPWRRAIDEAATLEQYAARYDAHAADAAKSTTEEVKQALNELRKLANDFESKDKQDKKKLRRLSGKLRSLQDELSKYQGEWSEVSVHLHEEVAMYESYAEQLAPPTTGVNMKVCKSRVGERIMGISISPESEFDGTEAICVGGAGIRGCSRPSKKSGYRPVRVAKSLPQPAAELSAVVGAVKDAATIVIEDVIEDVIEHENPDDKGER